MSDFTFGRKKAGTSNFSSPSLVSPHTPTLANPVRGFGLPTNNVIQTQTAESAEQQAAQAADERSKLLRALEQPSFGHHISRYALRRPQAELMMAEPGDKYEMEAPESTEQQQAQPAAEKSLLLQALEQPSFGHHISRIALRRPQAKLTVGEPGDKYEQEADWMANQVMRMVVPDKPNTDSVQPVEDSLQRKCTACEQEEEKIQTKPSIQMATDGGFEAGDNIESRLNSSKGGGSPLAPEVRSFMEPRFGADFSGVRVHTGSNAVQMNRELGAQAFTHGSDVYFGAGKSAGNNELTAHELTHVVQQTGGVQRQPDNDNDDDDYDDDDYDDRGRRRRGPKETSKGARPKNCPPGTKPIDQSGLDKDDVHGIKEQIGAGPKDWVGVTPDGHIVTGDDQGNVIDHGPKESYLHRSNSGAEERAQEAIPSWVWAVIGTAAAAAIIACFASGVCEAAGLIALMGEGIATLVIEILEAAGIGVATASAS